MNRFRYRLFTASSRLACFAVLAVAGMIALTPLPTRAADAGRDDLAVAMVAYEACRWSDAGAALVKAADAGSVRASEIMGFIYLYGDTMYGGAVRSDRVAARHWFVRAANGGSEVAKLIAGQLSVADVDWMNYGIDTPSASTNDRTDWANIGIEAPSAVARRR